MAGDHPFDEALRFDELPSSKTGDRRFGVDLDERWWVGTSGPWGGYIAACFAKAVNAAVPELPLMSLGVHFVRRMRPGVATVGVRVESRGSRVGHVMAELVQDDHVGAMAIATVGLNPQPDFVTDFPLPDAPHPDLVERRTESSHPYMQLVDVRPTVVVRPWSGDNEGTLEGWVRLAGPRPFDVPLLAALPDSWTPGMWARLTTRAGKVTVNMTTHFRGEAAADLEWCFIRVRTGHVERGFADEDCLVWGQDGRLLVQSRQLVLLSR